MFRKRKKTEFVEQVGGATDFHKYDMVGCGRCVHVLKFINFKYRQKKANLDVSAGV
jgi:hypothetical protein